MEQRSDEEKEYDRRKTAWETHFATIVNSVVVAGLIFLGTQIWTANAQLTKLTVTNEYLTTTVMDLKKQINDMTLNYVTKADFKDLEIRVRMVEKH